MTDTHSGSRFACVVAATSLLVISVSARAVELSAGDELIGTTSALNYAIIDQYRQAQKVDTLVTGPVNPSMPSGLPNKWVAGMCTSTDLNYLFAVASNADSSSIVRFDRSGVVAPLNPTASTWVEIPHNPSVACVTDRQRNVYVLAQANPGVSGDRGSLQRFDANAGRAYLNPANIGIADSMDLSYDQCTMIYTAGGKIKRFDVCSGTQLSDLDQTNTGPNCTFARFKGVSQTMVICSGRAVLMSGSWSVNASFEPGACFADRPSAAASATFDSLSFTEDGRSFWALVKTASPSVNPRACRYSVETGNTSSNFDVPVRHSILVYGEKTAASNRCMRLRGKLLCLVYAFPYLRFIDRPEHSIFHQRMR